MAARAHVALILLTFVTACSGPGSSLPKALRALQFSTLKGMAVENNDGEKLGVLADFTLDLETGAAEFGLIKTGGTGPFGTKRIVPADYFILGSVKPGTMSLDVTGNRWGAAPIFNRKHIGVLNQPSRRKEIFAYYDRCVTGRGSGRDSIITPTGPTSTDHREARPMALAGDLLNDSIFDSSQKRIGKVKDLLIDPKGRQKTMIIFCTGSYFKSGRTYAVPFEAVTVDERKDAVTLKVPADLSHAKPFDWSRAGSDSLFSYP